MNNKTSIILKILLITSCFAQVLFSCQPPEVKKEKENSILDSVVYKSSNPYSQIIRKEENGFVIFIFKNNPKAFYLTDSLPVVDLVSHNVFDANGDNNPDLIIRWHPRSGHCQAEYIRLFCFDPKTNAFRLIENACNIPNPEFIKSENSIVGEMDCELTKYMYKFKWSGVALDTVYIKTVPILDQ